MFLFLYISAISGLQLKLIPLQYKRGDVQDQAYTVNLKFHISGCNHS